MKGWERVSQKSLGGHVLSVYESGKRTSQSKLCVFLHGVPTWSVLWDEVVFFLRQKTEDVYCIALDWAGFGFSTKDIPKEGRELYFLELKLFKYFLEKEDIRECVLVGHDWGGILGLRVALENPRVRAFFATNTAFPLGGPLPQAFLVWRNFVRSHRLWDVGALIAQSCMRKLSLEKKLLFQKPFQEEKDFWATQALVQLVPQSPQDFLAKEHRALFESLRNSPKPFGMCFSTEDPITRPAKAFFKAWLKNAWEYPVEIKGGHFSPLEEPEILAEAIRHFLSERVYLTGL